VAIAVAGFRDATALSRVTTSHDIFAVAKRLIGRALYAAITLVADLGDALLGHLPRAANTALKAVAITLSRVFDASVTAVVSPPAPASIGTTSGRAAANGGNACEENE